MNKKFNLGGGPTPLHDFINIDALDIDADWFIKWDLSTGLPPETVGASYFTSCHFWEHMYPKDGLLLMQRCYENLEEGGTFRLGVPNFNDMVTNYLAGNWDHWDMLLHDLDRYSPIKELRTIIDICQEGVYQYSTDPYQTHKSLWDVPKALKMLEYVGFKDVKEVPYDYSIDPPWEMRRRFTLVVEGTK